MVTTETSEQNEEVEEKHIYTIVIPEGSEWKKGAIVTIKWNYSKDAEVPGYVNVRLIKVSNGKTTDAGVYGQVLTSSKMFKFTVAEDASNGEMYYVTISSMWKDYAIGKGDADGTASEAFIIKSGKIHAADKEESSQAKYEEEKNTSEATTESTTTEGETSGIGISAVSMIVFFVGSLLVFLAV